MTRRRVMLIVAVLVALGVAAWYFFFRGGHGSAQTPAPPSPVAAVQTQPLGEKQVTEVLNVFGTVTTGQLEAVNFPRAGQVTHAWVLEGRKVASGAPIATLQSDPAARLAYTQALNAAGLAERELAHTEELYRLQLATRSQLDSARNAVRDAQAAVQAQRALGGDLQTATVRAPFDGVVVKLGVAQGDRVQPGATIAQLGHLDTLRVQLGIEPNESRRVKVGMPVTLEPVNGKRETVHAKVDELHDLIDPRTQLINALVLLPSSAARALVPGMKVTGSITLGSHLAWVVPRQSVLEDEKGAYIFQVEDGKARRVNVTKGLPHGNLQEIRGPFDPRLPVVTLGNYELAEGMAVRESARTAGTPVSRDMSGR